MSLPVILTEQAKQDLRDIWRGLTEFAVLKRADDRMIAIRKKFYCLGSFRVLGVVVMSYCRD